jgi:hypothetical protein
MWQRRFGIPTPDGWPAASGFTVSLTVVAVLNLFHPSDVGHSQSLGLPALALGAFVCSWTASYAAAAVVGGIAWLFDNGFVTGGAGELHRPEVADAVALLLLVGVALASARLGSRHRARSSALSPSWPEIVDGDPAAARLSVSGSALPASTRRQEPAGRC